MEIQEAIEALNLEGIEIGGPARRMANFCGALDAAIYAMKELQKYQQIGTLEECRESVEKQKRKTPRASNRCYVCPHCGLVTSLKIKHNYCDACGQHIDWNVDWSDEE